MALLNCNTAMEGKKYYVAIDLGATSGRTMLAACGEEGMEMEVVNRFPNGPIRAQGHYYWDIYALLGHILDGLKAVAQRGIVPESIGVDTWGVDFAMIGKDGKLLSLPLSYRDHITDGAPEAFFKRVPADELYAKTGLQVMNFNSIFQIDALRRAGSSALEAAAKIAFMPDAISYLLTGVNVTEYTIASTSALVNAKERKLDAELLKAVGFTEDNFGPMVRPGAVVGTLTAEAQEITGLPAVKVVAVGGHDTASAVAAVPAMGKNFAYLSSGTWSLMGIEVDKPIINDESRTLNYTNEGGVGGTIRFLKNICGMWLLERCRGEWGDADYESLIAECMASEPFRSLIDPDAPCFANPTVMTKAIADYCVATGQPAPETRGQFTRCIFESLALKYREVIDNLRAMSPHPIEVLHIIGGGSRNALLNQWTANAIGMRVVAGPAECTALGNVMVQAGMSREQMAAAVETTEYLPQDQATWTEAYDKYLKIIK